MREDWRTAADCSPVLRAVSCTAFPVYFFKVSARKAATAGMLA